MAMRANVRRAACAMLGALSITATLASASASVARAESGVSDKPHTFHRFREEGPPITITSNNGVDMLYFGGHVISHVQIVAVMWTSKVYSQLQSQVSSFFSTIVDSTYMDWLGEYDTAGIKGNDGKAGSSQHVNHGKFLKTVTITPSITKTTVTDAQIGQELAAQIKSGILPSPTTDAEGGVNTLYVVYFPPGVGIQDGQGGVSCNSGGGGNQVFCGYHSSYVDTSGNVPYAVIPDLSSQACVQGCGAGSAIEDYGVAASHEMVEAITDPEIGAGGGLGIGRPMAWYDTQQGEVGDICANQQDFTATIGGFTVQKIWSQKNGACIAEDPSLTACDGTTRPCKACVASDCTGATSICDDTSGMCRGCKTDGDCSTGTCDVASGACTTSSGTGGGAGTGGAGSSNGASGGGGSAGSSGNGASGGIGLNQNGDGGAGPNGAESDTPGDGSTTTTSGMCSAGKVGAGTSDEGIGLFVGLLALTRLAAWKKIRRKNSPALR
jgi:hypothetical protein